MEKSSGFMVVSEKSWEDATPKQQSWYIYNTLVDMNERLKKLERRSLFHKVCAFIGGVIGGALAAYGVKMS